jgi:hypothetical protein
MGFICTKDLSNILDENNWMIKQGNEISSFSSYWIGLRRYCANCPFQWEDWGLLNFVAWAEGECLISTVYKPSKLFMTFISRKLLL